MHAKPMGYALGACLLAATMAAANMGPSWFEAYATGAKTLALHGQAEFGSVKGDTDSGAFVLTLGAESPAGAVLFTRANGVRPEPGTYDLGDDPSRAIQALVVTGPPTRPTGVFRARAGRLTIARSSDDLMDGYFEIDAVGFDAANPADEVRELRLRGAFTASPTVRQPEQARRQGNRVELTSGR
jgi:hypothetical protein